VRLLHWVNAFALVVMAGSGLQILVAYPRMGPQGELYRWYPLQDWLPPEWMRVGGWLAGGRAWHFAFAWLLILNGLAYLAYLAISGEWRRRLFLPRRDARAALQMVAYYLRLRKTPPEQGLYNGLQRATYTGVLGLGILVVLSGLALYKPVQLELLTRVLGGYDVARLIHFVTLAFFAGFTVTHLVLVTLHPRALAEIFTGGSVAPVAREDRRG
jgi:thiosulfate reductase cytochrome b subunit